MSKSTRRTAAKGSDSGVTIKIPITFLASCVAMQPGEEYEMNGQLDNGGPKKKVLFHGAVTGTEMSFSLKEEGKLHQLFSGLWHCEITSGIRKVHNESVATKNDCQANENSEVTSLKRKRGRPPKVNKRNRRNVEGRKESGDTPKDKPVDIACEQDTESDRLVISDEVIVTGPGGDAVMPSMDIAKTNVVKIHRLNSAEFPNIEPTPVVDSSGADDMIEYDVIDDDDDDDDNDDDFIPPSSKNKVAKPKTCRRSTSKTQVNISNDKPSLKIKVESESPTEMNFRENDLQKKVIDADIPIEPGIIVNPSNCRICDQTFDSGIQEHLETVHSVDWSQYEKVIYVIELHYQRRQLKKDDSVSSEVRNMDLRELPLSKPNALKMLCQWRKSNVGDDSYAEPCNDRRAPKAVVVNNVNFFQCGQCERLFRRRSNLQSHTRHVHNKDATAQQEAQKRRSTLNVTYMPGVQGKYHQFYADNTELCRKLGIIGDGEDSKPTTGCLLCRRVIVGFNNRNRLVKHLTEKHLVDLDQYNQVITAGSEDERKSLVTKILADENEQKIQRKRHRLGAGQSKYLQCPACLNFYSTPQNLLSHVRHIHKSVDNFSELLKNVEAETSKLYKVHVQRPEELQVKCPYCKETRLGRSIIKHLHLAHGDEPDISNALAIAEKEYSTLMRQRESKRKLKLEMDLKMKGTIYPCQFCGREFTCRPTRHRHSKFNCESNPNRAEAYWCTCGRRHTSRAALDLHKEKCKIKKQQFQCHICGKVYQTRAGMYTHKRTSHMDRKESYKYNCDVCHKKFYQKHHYVRHAAIHTEDRKCQCELCGKQYKTPDAVKKHQMAVHYNKYPYYCKLCGHGMAKKQYLKAHRCGNVRRSQNTDHMLHHFPKVEKDESLKVDTSGFEAQSAVQTIEQSNPVNTTTIGQIEISQAALAEFSRSVPQVYPNIQGSESQKSGDSLAEPSILQVFPTTSEYQVVQEVPAEPLTGSAPTHQEATASEGVMEVYSSQGVPLKYQYYNVMSLYEVPATYVANKDTTPTEQQL